MSNNRDNRTSDNLIDPNKVNNKPQTEGVKRINHSKDGLIERKDQKVLTDDGKELLKEEDQEEDNS